MKLSDLIFDRCCRLCEGPVEEGVVCSKCDEYIHNIAKIRTRSIFVDERKIEAKYLFDYDNSAVKKLLFALKRNSDKELFEYASRLYCTLIPLDFCGTVTNVPRRGINIRNAGFDQVAEPCKIMCKKNPTCLEYAKLLKRKGFTKEQKNLTSSERKRNVSGKFRVKIKDIPKNILIVDDVVTTANTAAECAREILKSEPNAQIAFIFLASGN